jgi:hypothetical protein
VSPAAVARRVLEARRGAHLRIVDLPARRRIGRLRGRALAAAVVLVVAGMFAVAVCQANLVKGQLRLDQLEQQVAEGQARYEELRLKVAEMESPERIVREATARGMVSPGDVVYVFPEGPADNVEPQQPADGDVAAGDWSEVKPYLEARP